ncbi:hypothetical protein JOF56_009297 [Kibdelosporangium banguiense]|uniref:Transposase DDE domain group 1 n=1 Tax=Kibdelosporangium banguiense TaxID=1365924 RepID=A0ABS4TX06_9PSEU|nr:hypothetical protein [Kibdelosporangium banguiense]
MQDITSWSADLAVETGGRDVINHAGTAALRLIADRTGLTTGLSHALRSQAVRRSAADHPYRGRRLLRAGGAAIGETFLDQRGVSPWSGRGCGSG